MVKFLKDGNINIPHLEGNFQDTAHLKYGLPF